MADSRLQRTHPLTVVVRGGVTFTQTVFAFLVLGVSSMGSGSLLAAIGTGALVLLAGVLIAGGTWLSWRYFYYGVVGDDLVINAGWLIKKHRSIPLARIQGVDIRADLLSRLLGLANVVVQTAGGGGGEAEAKIGSITLSDAERLRAQLISGREQATTAGAPATASAVATPAASGTGLPAHASGNTDPIGHLSDFRGALGGVKHHEPEPVFEHAVPLLSLIVAALTSTSTFVVLGVVIGAAVVPLVVTSMTGVVDSTTGLITGAIVFGSLGLPLLLVVGSTLFATVARDFGFRIRRAGQRLETESGLIERRMTSVPVRRVQAVIIESSALRRVFKLASVRINTAGFGAGEEQQATTAPALIPIARTKEVRPLMHRLLPEAEQFPQIQRVPAHALRFYVLLPTLGSLLASLAVVGLPLLYNMQMQLSEALALVSPLILAVAVGIATGVTALGRVLMWSASGFGLDRSAVAVAYGALGRTRARIGRSRIQSLAIRQSPFQRAAGLATMQIATVSGSGKAVFAVRHLRLDDAIAIENWYSPDPKQAPVSDANRPLAPDTASPEPKWQPDLPYDPDAPYEPPVAQPPRPVPAVAPVDPPVRPSAPAPEFPPSTLPGYTLGMPSPTDDTPEGEPS